MANKFWLIEIHIGNEKHFSDGNSMVENESGENRISLSIFRPLNFMFSIFFHNVIFIEISILYIS